MISFVQLNLNKHQDHLPRLTMSSGVGLNAFFVFLGLAPLAKDFFPSKQSAHTVVRVSAGLAQAGDGAANTGGHAPNIALFDPNGARLGFMSAEKQGIIKEGNFKDISVEHMDSSNNKPAEYVALTSGGTDAICIAYLMITWASGDNFQFFGDIGRTCGGKWYPSNLPVPNDNDKQFTPSCMWIDSPDPGTGNEFAYGFSFHAKDFGTSKTRAAGYQATPDSLCKSLPRFHLWGAELTSELQCIPIFDPPIAYQVDGSDPADLTTIINNPGKVNCAPGPNVRPTMQDIAKLYRKVSMKTGWVSTYGTKKRSTVAKHTAGFDFCKDNRLVVSEWHGHSAQDVCTDPNSRGPDFISSKEGLYCDMCNRVLYDLCSTTLKTGCFDLSSHTLKPGQTTNLRKMEALPPVLLQTGRVEHSAVLFIGDPLDEVSHYTAR